MPQRFARSLALLVVLVAAAPFASAQDVELPFIPSASPDVAGYYVYVAPYTTGPLVAAPIDVGRPQVDAQGVARARLSGIEPETLVFEMTSYDASRRESARSNRVSLARPAESLAPPLWLSGFESASVGAHPTGFTDSGGAFVVGEHPVGNLALGTAAADGTLVSRYTARDSVGWAPYELSGRVLFLPGSRRGGVAVRVKPSARASEGTFGSGFLLGVDASGGFTLQSGSATPLRCAGSPSTGVGAYAYRWYRFRLRYTEPDARSRLRAKVWQDGQAQPEAWQVDCWTDGLPPAPSGVFALYREGWGVVYWDDLSVRPVRGWWDRIPYL